MAEEYFLLGNEACAKGAIHAGCRFFAGYPITPSTEIAEALAKELPLIGGSFIQMEDEIGSAGALVGASWGGCKAMTATSGPGISLMQENIGFAFMSETPIVIINVQRGSPSTGQPTMTSQSDMMQVRWGSHGDYEPIALAPSSVQEFFDFTVRAFNLAEKYRCPVFVMADEAVGHMREKMTIPDKIDVINRELPLESPNNYLPYKTKENGVSKMPAFGDGYNVHITGLTHDERGYPDTNDPETHMELVKRLCNKILKNRQDIVSYKTENVDDADLIIVTYGSPYRSSKTAINQARDLGLKVGILKIDTPWPFPEEIVEELSKKADKLLVVEQNLGQMFYEVERVAKSNANVYLFEKIGGMLHSPDEILEKIKELMEV